MPAERGADVAFTSRARPAKLKWRPVPSRERHDQSDGFTKNLLSVDFFAYSLTNSLELPVSDHPKIALIAAVLLADPSDRRTLGQWAEHVAVSERSLKRLMVQQTGLSFGRWRRQLHLVIALRELAGGATVQQVAGDLGYESTTAFIVMFRKALGTTPSRYFADRLLSAERA